MVRVVATGVFDIIHLGHVHFLEKAKDLGDELVVIVARDKTARKMKHEPITSEGMRVELVQSLKPVDRAVLGYEDDMYRIISEVRPDIIALGYDQKFDEKELERELKKRGLTVQIVRLPHLDHDLDGTRKIIRRIVDWNIAQQKLKKAEGAKKK
jgi:FAD synthetase